MNNKMQEAKESSDRAITIAKKILNEGKPRDKKVLTANLLDVYA